MNTTRIKALEWVCPRCGAPAGVACKGRRGGRSSVHRERTFKSRPNPLLLALEERRKVAASLDPVLKIPCSKCGAAIGQPCGCEPRGVSFGDLSPQGRDAFKRGIQACESPIEKHFLAALLIQTMGHPSFGFSIESAAPDNGRYGSDEVVCVPQFVVGPYRLDFALFNLRKSRGTHVEIVAVECDGHDFHERTKQQAQRDKARDRWLTTSGFTVLRFTGSEIFKDSLAAADEVIEYLERP